jgi:hypothetical protein
VRNTGYLVRSNKNAPSDFKVPRFNYDIQYTGDWLEGLQTAPLYTVFTNYCGFLTSHKIPRVLCNPKVHYRVHNSPSLVRIWSQYTLTLFKMHFNIILRSMIRPSKQSLPFRICVYLLCVPHATPISSSLLCSLWHMIKTTNHVFFKTFIQPHVTSSLSGPNILLGTLFSNILNLCSSFAERDQLSHSYKNRKHIKVKGNVFHVHIMKLCNGRRGITLHSLNLSTGWG